jgi:hypothetical protein
MERKLAHVADQELEGSVDQEHNSPVEQQVDALVREFKTYAKKTSTNVLGLASTIIKVDYELNGRDRARFYEKVGLDPDGSTVRKLRVIGNKLPRFQPYLDVLPNSWTTLYRLASLEDEDFKKVVDSGVLNPFAMWKDIEAVLGKSSRTSKGKFKVFLDLNKLPVRSRQAEFARRLNNLATEYHLELKAPNHEDDLSSLIEEFDEVEQAA